MLSTQTPADEMTDEEYFAEYSHPILVSQTDEFGVEDLIPIDYKKEDWLHIVEAKTQNLLSEILIATSE